MPVQATNLIEEFNRVLATKDGCVVNIVNDKLTLAVFSLLQENLSKVKEINFVLRDSRYIPQSQEISHEFEININDALFNSYDIVEKNTLTHFDKAKAMYDFIREHINIKRTTSSCQIKGNVLLVDNDFMIQGSSSLELSNKVKKSKVSDFNFDSIISSTFVTTPQPNNAEVDLRLLYANIKNKNNKRSFYTELMVKTYILNNSKLIQDITSIFDTQIWYDETKKMEFYYKLRELQACKEKQARTVIAQEKVQLNTQMKKLIACLRSFFNSKLFVQIFQII